MTNFILAIVLLLLALTGVVIRKTYYYLPARELKRRAARSDPLAARLYSAVAYDGSLRALLWVFIALTSSGSLILLVRVAPLWLSLPAVALLLWAAFSWLPATRTTRLGRRLTIIVTPLITWLLNYLHAPLSRGADLARRRYTAPAHTGLFERDDLLELIERQLQQSDSRLSQEELEIAKRALSFGDHKVSDILIPRKKIRTILASDTIGPILIDELHKSGQSYALVSDKPKGEIVGSLRFSKLSLDSSGQVRDLMDDAVYYLHENDNLTEALHAFFATNHPVFIVVDNLEEYLGIITIESILHQLLGHVPGDDFDKYNDQTAVATRHVKTQKPEESDPEQTGPETEEPDIKPEAIKETDKTPVKTDEEMVE